MLTTRQLDHVQLVFTDDRAGKHLGRFATPKLVHANTYYKKSVAPVPTT